MTTLTSANQTWNIEQLRDELTDPVSSMIPDRGPLTFEFLVKPKAIPDATTKLLVRDASGSRIAVILISSPISPDIAQRSVRRAGEIKSKLPPQLGCVIHDPIGCGTIMGCSYSVHSYCTPMSRNKLYKQYHRAVMRAIVPEWLNRVT